MLVAFEIKVGILNRFVFEFKSKRKQKQVLYLERTWIVKLDIQTQELSLTQCVVYTPVHSIQTKFQIMFLCSEFLSLLKNNFWFINFKIKKNNTKQGLKFCLDSINLS